MTARVAGIARIVALEGMLGTKERAYVLEGVLEGLAQLLGIIPGEVLIALHVLVEEPLHGRRVFQVGRVKERGEAENEFDITHALVCHAEAQKGAEVGFSCERLE